ncbi:MAG TPA: cytochrome b6-f complex subunit 6 [Synechococcales cyanobacterium M55_K2018_004]|nr:cytochrome b6-f complex subunit 6 [Synechococcales cyanobacterium M55_K2018_004]
MGIVAYVVILGAVFVTAIGLFKVLRGANLI